MGSQRSVTCPGSNIPGAYSALQLLRSYNLLHPVPDPITRYENYSTRLAIDNPESSQTEPLREPSTTTSMLTSSLSGAYALPAGILQPPIISAVPPLLQSIPQILTKSMSTDVVMNRHLLTNGIVSNLSPRRPRSEKKPIPDNQKDDRYYERRKRNNQAAKKSRDARKIREDRIALRATILEHENAILRAQVATLREEAQSLRHMLINFDRPLSNSSIL